MSVFESFIYLFSYIAPSLIINVLVKIIQHKSIGGKEMTAALQGPINIHQVSFQRKRTVHEKIEMLRAFYAKLKEAILFNGAVILT